MKLQSLSKTTGCMVGTIAIAVLTTSCNHMMSHRSPTNAPASPMEQIDHGQIRGGMSHGGIELGTADADYDLRLIDGMMPHHAGALTMAQSVRQNSQRPELKKLAESIITGQTQEIAMMQQWRKAWYPKQAATPMAWHVGMPHMMPMAPEQLKAMRMDLDLGKADADFDRRFLDAMIPHHEGAVVMAQDALAKSKRPEIQKIAQAIMVSQQQEINQMKQWRKEWYGK